MGGKPKTRVSVEAGRSSFQLKVGEREGGKHWNVGGARVRGSECKWGWGV